MERRDSAGQAVPQTGYKRIIGTGQSIATRIENLLDRTLIDEDGLFSRTYHQGGSIVEVFFGVFKYECVVI